MALHISIDEIEKPAESMAEKSVEQSHPKWCGHCLKMRDHLVIGIAYLSPMLFLKWPNIYLQFVDVNAIFSITYRKSCPSHRTELKGAIETVLFQLAPSFSY